eukprot:6491873-Amphidinium_carterae.2
MGQSTFPSRHRQTAIEQLLIWVSQFRADIAFAGKELSKSLQQTGDEDLKNIKQLLRNIQGGKLTLAPKATYNEKNDIQVHIESFADSDWASCNSTRRSTIGTITSCWGTPLIHIRRTQSTMALSSAEAELYAMGQATVEAQHIKQ